MNKRLRPTILLSCLFFIFVTAIGLSLWKAKRQYALNRALITALVHNDTKKALMLINAGADPNTRYKPTPAPSFTQLWQPSLHHKPLSVLDSPIALTMACGMGSPLSENRFAGWVNVRDDLPLVRAMLRHGADVNARTSVKVNSKLTYSATILITAVIYRDVEWVELLLEYGATVNATSYADKSALMWAAIRGEDKKVEVLLSIMPPRIRTVV